MVQISTSMYQKYTHIYTHLYIHINWYSEFLTNVSLSYNLNPSSVSHPGLKTNLTLENPHVWKEMHLHSWWVFRPVMLILRGKTSFFPIASAENGGIEVATTRWVPDPLRSITPIGRVTSPQLPIYIFFFWPLNYYWRDTHCSLKHDNGRKGRYM